MLKCYKNRWRPELVRCLYFSIKSEAPISDKPKVAKVTFPDLGKLFKVVEDNTEVRFSANRSGSKTRPDKNVLLGEKKVIRDRHQVNSFMDRLRVQDRRAAGRKEDNPEPALDNFKEVVADTDFDVAPAEPVASPLEPVLRQLTPVVSTAPEGLERMLEVFRDLGDLYPFLRLKVPPAPDSKASKTFWLRFASLTGNRHDVLDAWLLLNGDSPTHLEDQVSPVELYTTTVNSHRAHPAVPQT